MQNIIQQLQKTAEPKQSLHKPEKPLDRRTPVTSWERLKNHLQAKYGNHTVGRLAASGRLQAQLRISKPGDVQELEADKTAERVMSMPAPVIVHREKDEDELKRQPAEEAAEPATQASAKQPAALNTALLQRREKDDEELNQQPVEDEAERKASVPVSFKQSAYSGRLFASLVQKVEERKQGISPQNNTRQKPGNFDRFIREQQQTQQESKSAAPGPGVSHLIRQRAICLERLAQFRAARAGMQPVTEEDKEAAGAQAVVSRQEEEVEEKSISRQLTEEEEISKQPHESAEEEEEEEGTGEQLAVSRQPDEEKEVLKQGAEEEEENAGAEAQALNAKHRESGEAAVDTHIEGNIRHAAAWGDTLPSHTQDFFEGRFGADFSGVRVHNDQKAHETSQAINARAYTLGNHIMFGKGEYAPTTTSGRKLLAHELTHVVQQNPGVVGKKAFVPVEPEQVQTEEAVPPAEVEAEQAAAVPGNEQETKTGAAIVPANKGEKVSGGTAPEKQQEVKAGATAVLENKGEKQPGKATDLENQQEAKPGEKGEAKGKEGAAAEAVQPPEAEAGALPAVGGKEAATEQGAPGVTAEKTLAPAAGAGGEPKSGAAGAAQQAPGEGKEQGEQKKIELAANPKDLIKAFSQVPATQMLEQYNQSVDASQGVFEKEKAGLEQTLPKIKASDLTAQAAETPKKKTASKAVKPPDRFTGQKPDVKTQPPVDKIPDKRFEQKPKSYANPYTGAGDKEIDAKEAGKAIDNIRLDKSKVPANLGPAPGVDMGGAADPGQLDNFQQESGAEVQQAKAQALQQANQDFGENGIYAAKDESEIGTAQQLKAVSAGGEKLAPPGQGIPKEVQEDIDATMGAAMAPQLQKEVGQFDQAHSKYEVDKTKAREDTENQVAELKTETNAKQEEERQKTKEQVAAHRQEWKGEVEKQDKEFADKSQRITEDQRKQVNEEKAKAENKAEQHYKDAEKQAEKKKQEAEQDADNEKEKGKEEKPKGLFGWIGSALSKVIDGIKQAVNFIFEKLRDFVKGVFEAAKKLAMAAIDAARSLIVKVIEGAAKLLKGLVSVVFAAFPGIAKRINAKIDEAVDKAKQAVNALADKLKAGVAKVLDVLASVLDAALAFVQEAYNFALTAIGMIAKGEFAELGRYIVQSALKLLGAALSGLMKLLGIGEEDLKKIIDNPIGFLKNLVDAVKLGLDNFVKNIWKHLMSGLVSWLFGAFSGVIELPKEFNLAGIFHLVAQVLGVTWQNIRAKIVQKLGPAGETICTVLETGFEFVKILVTQGPIALWDQIKEALSDLKDMVFGAIIEWLRNKIIIEGVAFLIKMFNPAGAIIQAVQTIYNTALWLYERWQQIQAFVQAVFESIKNIAAGKIAGAAQWIENSLAKAIPLAISFMAGLLNISGITDKVKEVLAKIRKPIDKAMDKVIDWLITMGKKLVGGVKKGFGKLKEKGKQIVGMFVEWWKIKKNFKTKNGEKHLIFFQGEDENAHLMIKSSPPKTYEAYIKKIDAKTKEQKDAKETALKCGTQIDRLKIEVQKKHRQYKDPEKDKGIKKQADDIKMEMTKLVHEMTIQLMLLLEEQDIPEQRFLPALFDEKDKMRNYFYIRGSGFETISKKKRISKADYINSQFNEIKKADNEAKKQSIWKDLLRDQLVPDDAMRDSFVQKKMKPEKLHTDHKTDLAKHWSKTGYETSDEERHRWATIDNNLSVMYYTYNLGKPRFEYIKYVGRKFSSLYNKCPFGSNNIRGKKFK